MADQALPEEGGEYDWIFDYVLSVFQSPLWDLTVMGIIDDNCIIFDNEEENKFEYTDIHNMFKEQVEQLLTQHLAELGVSEEMFLEACETARHSRDINTEVYDQVVAMDDFLTFKKLMVKRNMELELEAVRELQSEGVPVVAPSNSEEAEATFQKELKQSADLTTAEVKQISRELEEEGEVAQAKGEPKEGAELHAQVLEEMDANLMEMELLHKKEEMEQMELEKAIAMSLALEEERMRMAQKEVGAGKGGLKPISSSKMKPIKSAPQRDINLPSLEELQKQMDSKRKQAQEAFKRNQEMLQQQLNAQQELRQQAGVTETDMERRARHLKAQRDKILAKKKAEREAKAKEQAEKEAERKAKMAEQISKAAPEIVRSVSTEELGEENSAPGGSGEGKFDPADERRRLMRIALARRMKQDLLENEEERLTKMQAEQFNDLDRKLRLVEQLREENRQKENELNRAVQAQQQVRARNVQRSAVRAQMGEDFEFAEG
mmetsp:Transcript_34674/g.45850  ORF Transcript_34674/g.45850 Transcript_34674/m.45850 type:complete len:492 (-) Transcript_34674:387-1862(-)